MEPRALISVEPEELWKQHWEAEEPFVWNWTSLAEEAAFLKLEARCSHRRRSVQTEQAAVAAKHVQQQRVAEELHEEELELLCLVDWAVLSASQHLNLQDSNWYFR